MTNMTTNILGEMKNIVQIQWKALMNGLENLNRSVKPATFSQEIRELVMKINGNGNLFKNFECILLMILLSLAVVGYHTA